ncbi:MAG: sugar MFS transporter, partial [Nanoarchaeota archaeon]|nr:sugar MFS transporter [Nanoarchaeota archaeon]
MRDIHLIYLFKFLKSMYFFSGVLIPFFTEWGGITFFQVMLLQTWFVFWTAILEVPTGAVADRWGYKTSIIYGVAINVLAVIVYVLVKSFF